MKGFLLVDKEKGLSSFSVVARIRKLSAEKRVGHSGTLDPMATGLLLVAVGEATKLLEYFIGCDKEYLAKAKFGFFSDTYDGEGKISEIDKNFKISRKLLQETIEENFRGEITQIPPKYSALKISGKRACDIVRKGGEVNLKARKVKVDSFKITKFNWPEVEFKIHCGSGTYVRSLINDLGEKLKCGAYLTELERVVVGGFSLEESCKLADLNKNIDQKLISLEKIPWCFNKLSLSDEEFERLRHGLTILNNKNVHNFPVLAFYKEKVVGVLEGIEDAAKLKFRKMIL